VSDAVPDGHISLDAIVAFADDELPPTPARRAAEHVERCLSCAMEVANQRRARHRLRDADAPGAPSSLLSTLRAIPDLPASPDPAAGGRTSAPVSPGRRRRLRRPGP
jgi:anti-sigma factor RsiW